MATTEMTTEATTARNGLALATGAVVLIAANVLFPRADDPWDIPAVLQMMADNPAPRQTSFLAVGVGLWLVTAGLVGLERSIRTPLSKVALHGAVLGAAVFTVSVGLGMAATGAASEWVAAGADPDSVDYAVATALNVADDGVWFLSIITYWGSLGLFGTAMVAAGPFPRWSALWIAAAGFVTALGVGVPLAFGVEAPVLFIAFGVLGMVTTLWALALGVWTMRRDAP